MLINATDSAVFNELLPADNVLGASTGIGYFDVLKQVSRDHNELAYLERLWAAWYLLMQNDTYATGILTFVLHEVFYFGRCIPFMILDMIPYFHKYKIQAQKMPTIKEQWNCAMLVLVSHFTAELPQIWFFHPVATYLGIEYRTPFPPVWKIILQISVFFVMEDTWHYWGHRALHYGPLYKHIHKQHHTYSAPFGLAAEYASPIETAILGFGVVGSPVVLLMITGDLHLLTMLIWMMLRLFQAIDAHSGYDFPWSLRHFVPFWAGADHHDLHHEKFIGNYASSFRWWDYCLDTEAGLEASKTASGWRGQLIRSGSDPTPGSRSYYPTEKVWFDTKASIPRTRIRTSHLQPWLSISADVTIIPNSLLETTVPVMAAAL